MRAAWKPEGMWITMLDLVEDGDKLVVKEMGEVGADGCWAGLAVVGGCWPLLAHLVITWCTHAHVVAATGVLLVHFTMSMLPAA